ncbi:MAG TPA: hypothetical protein DCL35_01515 [Candidatus Omnitrophica bacterium]|nr:hypothetical protein [Candidatus Omnitrophota bacterium]
MRSPVIWAIIAFLLGISLFGIYKSLELGTKNLVLSNSLSALKTELNMTQASLAAARQSLGDSYMKNAELEGQLALMDKRLDRQAEDIKGYVGKISFMSAKLAETARANAALYAENKGIANQSIRAKLETQEMRNKLSSIAELKKAIKELKVRISKEKKLKPASPSGQKKMARKNKTFALFARKEIIRQPIVGNGGFLIKDGRPTLNGVVDIRVVPAELSLSGTN